MRGAQSATRQSPGREDLLTRTDFILLPWGISPLRSDYRPRSGRNDIIKQANKKPSPLGARRGGAKHRKNSPRVTVFSQSVEVAMLRAGRWHECERKRTECRMRGIEPNNKIIVVFPSSVLPSRRFGNPPSPEGEGLTGCVHSCRLGALVEKSPAIGTRTPVRDYPPNTRPQGLRAVSRRSDRFRFREILTLRLRLRSE